MAQALTFRFTYDKLIYNQLLVEKEQTIWEKMLMESVIVVVIDEVLNFYTEMLVSEGIHYQNKNDPCLRARLYDMNRGRLTPEGAKVMRTVKPRKDGVALTRRLKSSGWTIVLCTDRDLRIAYGITVTWLREQRIQYDYLFTADRLIEFCEGIDARYLIFGLPDDYGLKIELYCFSKAANVPEQYAFEVMEFRSFEGVEQWIQRKGF